MDPRHPALGFTASLIGLFSLVVLIFSFLFPILTPKGWGQVETASLIVLILSSVISNWAKKEHDIPIVHEHGSSESQYMELENLPTMVSGGQGSFVNSNTAAVIESIVGVQTTQSKSQVVGAIDVLSSGEIGETSAHAATANQVQHAKVNLNDANVNLPTAEVKSVPLPSFDDVQEESAQPVSSMIDLDDLLEESESPQTQLDLPDLPDF